MVTADKYAGGDRIQAFRLTFRVVKAHARIFSLENAFPLCKRINNAAHLQFPVHWISRCAQLI